MSEINFRTLPVVYCLVCGRQATAPDSGGTVCSEGHVVRIWELRQEEQPGAAPAEIEESWRARPPLL